MFELNVHRCHVGAGIAQWLERCTPDWKVPAGAAGEFSSPWSSFCADSYFGIRSTPVLPPHVTTVVHKRSRSFCQKCRWQVTPKHTCGFEWSDTVTWCMAEFAPEQQHFTWDQPCNIHRVLPLLPWILIIRAIKGYSHSFRITCSRAENSAV